MISRIEFFLTETLVGLRRHPAMAFAAITCVAAAMFVIGMVGLVVVNAAFAVQSVREKVCFNVCFHPDTSRQEAWATFKKIEALPKVARADFVAKEKFWAQLQQDDPALVEELGANPLPDMVEVYPQDDSDIPALSEEFTAWPMVRSVKSDPQVSAFLQTWARAIRAGGAIVGLILAALALVIIHHTIELTIYARRKEIHIMALVGATPSTVAMPFLLEGLLYGLLGAGVAVGGLQLLYRLTMDSVMKEYGAHLLADSVQLTHGAWLLLAVGAALGLIGSAGSLLKHMRNPRSRLTNA